MSTITTGFSTICKEAERSKVIININYYYLLGIWGVIVQEMD